MAQKTITVVVPTYNEEKNVDLIYKRVRKVFDDHLPNYCLSMQFIDNCSTDQTRAHLERLCAEHEEVCAIFNAKNFGFSRSYYYGLTQAEGDCAVMIFADMQDPPEVIPQFVTAWEKGAKVVCGVRTESKESPLMFILRKQYYKLVKYISEIDHITGFDGFGLYDSSFIKVIRRLDDSLPYLRGIVAEFGMNRAEIPYKQEKRKEGKSNFKFIGLYDLAMLGITSYSKIPMHLATLIGFFLSMLCAIISIVILIMKLVNWDSFPLGSAASQIGIFFLGSVQIFLIGFVGEYIVNMNARTMHHPMVVEEKRINFPNKQKLEKTE